MLEILRDQTCSYLPERSATMRYRLAEQCPPHAYQALLARGWRRFGRTFFRPSCADCVACRSLRVDVEAFEPNRSMRRTMQRNRDLEIDFQPATLDVERLELYQRYHSDMAARKGWPNPPVSPRSYYQSFLDGNFEFGWEIAYRLDGRLVALALVDSMPDALSAVYCIYEPTLRTRSLGTFSVLTQIELAREHGLPHLYLGYWVDGDANVGYKAGFGPHEILSGRPALEESPTWSAPQDSSDADDAASSLAPPPDAARAPQRAHP